ncbi:unnamed protein product [Urochloa decumbens]|uniref:SKP1-like protein n=1 Tax=Urochloa decumbens TaxID=240449 RepID=A0ABC8WE93_9POAL
MSSAGETPAAEAPAATVISAADKSSGEEAEKVIVLRCCDGEEFAVAVPVARKCGTIRNMIDDDCVDGGVPLPNVGGPTMARVLEYLNTKAAAAAGAEEVAAGGAEEAAAANTKGFEKGFFEKMNKEALFDVILAANYLNAEELLDAAMLCAADRITGRTVAEIREFFGLENDFTPEEEVEIRKENSWAF